jgi:hypothetical protein
VHTDRESDRESARARERARKRVPRAGLRVLEREERRRNGSGHVGTCRFNTLHGCGP